MGISVINKVWEMQHSLTITKAIVPKVSPPSKPLIGEILLFSSPIEPIQQLPK